MTGIVRFVAGCVAAAGLLGCFEAHSPDADASIGVRDAATPDGATNAADGGQDDAALEIVECEFPDDLPAGDWCHCWGLDVERGGPGICLNPRGDLTYCDIGVGCAAGEQLCNDIGWTLRDGQARRGVCVLRAMCLYLSEREEYRPQCYYEDGTPFETGELASTSCASRHDGRLCGPECGSCVAGETCVGVSERSGLGMCVRGTAGDSGSPDHCTWPDVENGVECGGANACLGFRLPPDVTAVEEHQPWHVCVPLTECREIASRYPDRFRCVE